MGNFVSKSNINANETETNLHNNYDEVTVISDGDDKFLEYIDPRSPSLAINRTPIFDKNVQPHEAISKNFDLTYDLEIETPQKAPNNFAKIFKTLGYDLQDPRSPNLLFNRTPIQFAKKYEIDESNVPSVEFTEIHEDEVSFESALSSICEEITQNLSDVQIDETPKKLLETNFDEETHTLEHDDPRSPSVGVERTPIVFGSNEKLAGITHEVDSKINEIFKEVTEEIKQYTKKQSVAEPNNVVYEERTDLQYSTPKRTEVLATIPNNRTPLSCLANKSQASKIVKPKGELRMALKNAINKNVVKDENTPEMGHVNQAQNSLPKSNKTRIPVVRRTFAPIPRN